MSLFRTAASISASATASFAASVSLCALVLAAPLAHAQVSLDDLRAQQAQAALSEHYAQRWAALPAADRGGFAAAERHWLRSARWQEQRACIAQQGAAMARTPEDIASACLAEVTLRRLDALRARSSAHLATLR
jgi:hypothetical protein